MFKFPFRRNTIPPEVSLDKLTSDEIRAKYRNDFNMRLGVTSLTKKQLIHAYMLADANRNNA